MKIDLHIHHEENDTTHKLLLHISKLVETIFKQGESIMASFQEVSDELDAIKTAVDAVKELGKQQIAEIQALKDQLAAGSPVTQEQLDSLDTKADSILAELAPDKPAESKSRR